MTPATIRNRDARRVLSPEDAMTDFTYVALDKLGRETRGALQVATLNEACQRLREMGFFPTKVVAKSQRLRVPRGQVTGKSANPFAAVLRLQLPGVGGRVRTRTLTTFTRQVSTLVEAGMPLIRGLRLLAEQETNPSFKTVIAELVVAIEGGSSFSEALARHPRVFNHLYVSMVKAGEVAGALEVVLKRLAEFMEKAARMKGKILSALYYPVTVLSIASVIVACLLVFVVPRFRSTFQDLSGNQPMPGFTRFVLGVSDLMRHNFIIVAGVSTSLLVLLTIAKRTAWGTAIYDRLKLRLPLSGPIVRKTAISRFTRTLGTLLGSGVPILQALNIVRETAGNEVIKRAVAKVHDRVKEGDSITVPLQASGVFPSIVVGMVDVGEQTGALPDMLLKIADNYEEEVDNAVAGMTSLLEPLMLVILAVVVGSIVIGMFLPILQLAHGGFDNNPHDPGN